MPPDSRRGWSLIASGLFGLALWLSLGSVAIETKPREPSHTANPCISVLDPICGRYFCDVKAGVLTCCVFRCCYVFIVWVMLQAVVLIPVLLESNVAKVRDVLVVNACGLEYLCSVGDSKFPSLHFVFERLSRCCE